MRAAAEVISAGEEGVVVVGVEPRAGMGTETDRGGLEASESSCLAG